MSNNQLTLQADRNEQDLERLYRLQVRELEDFAMFVSTPRGIITTWNRCVEKTFGYSADEWIGQHAGIIFNEEDRAAGVVEQELQTAADQGCCVDLRWHQRKDGTCMSM